MSLRNKKVLNKVFEITFCFIDIDFKFFIFYIIWWPIMYYNFYLHVLYLHVWFSVPVRESRFFPLSAGFTDKYFNHSSLCKDWLTSFVVLNSISSFMGSQRRMITSCIVAYGPNTYPAVVFWILWSLLIKYIGICAYTTL